MARIKPKQLRKISDGRVFTYTDKLARRSDMVPVWEDGVDPNIAAGNLTPEEVDESKQGQLRSSLAEKNKMLLEKDKQIEALTQQTIDQNTEIERLNITIANLSKPSIEGDEQEEQPPENQARKEKIAATLKAILEENDPNNFTGSGKVRIEVIEALSELTGVSAAERDAAMEAISE